jgi:hypothetical protein
LSLTTPCPGGFGSLGIVQTVKRLRKSRNRTDTVRRDFSARGKGAVRNTVLPAGPRLTGPSRCSFRSVSNARTNFFPRDSEMLETTKAAIPRKRCGLWYKKLYHKKLMAQPACACEVRGGRSDCLVFEPLDNPVLHTHASAKFSDQGRGRKCWGR